MKFLIICLLLIYSSVSAYDGSQAYSFYSLKNINASVEYRKKDFSAIFGNFLFEQDGLFVFYENMGVQRLYIRKDEQYGNRMSVYQLPEIHMLPWLHPETYMEKRALLLKQKFFEEKCNTDIPLEEPLFAHFDSLHIDEHLYVEPKKLYDRNINHVIIGYSQKEGTHRFFYYVKYDDFFGKNEKRFAVYADVFKVVEKIDEKAVFPECR